MRALSFTQPWASLIACGAKRIETRSWWTPYHGPLAIHAAKAMPGWAEDCCFESPFVEVLEAAGFGGPESLPRGAVVATCRLVACLPTGAALPPRFVPAEHERDFGDFSLGRYAWLLADVVALPTPVPARGAPGLWPLPPEVERAVARGIETVMAGVG